MVVVGKSDCRYFFRFKGTGVLEGITDIQGQIVEMDGSIKALVAISISSEEDDDFEQGLDVMGMISFAGGGT